MQRIYALPLIVILMGIGAIAMYLPTGYAVAGRDWASARTYFYCGSLFLTLTVMIGFATARHQIKRPARSHLLALLTTYVALPLMLAFPLDVNVRDTSFLNAYFEMVSSLTTTGATVFDDPARLSGADHLWRALVGWMGGFLAWVTAIAILAPLNLGGFEVLSPQGQRVEGSALTQIDKIADPSLRLQRYAGALAPIYLVLTLVLWIALLLAGDAPLVAICHAMSTLATSGISPIGGVEAASSGTSGEMVIFIFLFFALSRQTFARDAGNRDSTQLIRDPEIRIGLVLVALVPLVLFARHWIGAYEVDTAGTAPAALSALWGAVFTVMSFMTTTGFESAGWASSRTWSGLETPGLILMGLALIGGGVATTAGGVKLLRVYALYKHGRREIEKLVHPSSVGGSGAAARQMRRHGAYIAWIFFMLFAMSIAVVMLALSLTGLSFEPTVILTIAALSTTGPLAAVVGETGISYATLPEPAKLILAASMVLGRLETLAIIALLNPEFWRN